MDLELPANSSTSQSVNQSLLSFINSATQSGLSAEQIKQQLLAKGWAETVIDYHFSLIDQKPSLNQSFSSPNKLWLLVGILVSTVIIGGGFFLYTNPNFLSTLPIFDDGQAEWTVLVYMGGDNDLEEAAIADINELEQVSPNKKVNVLVQIDRSPGYDESNGNWTGTKRYQIQSDNDVQTIGSTELVDLGEVDMTKAESLTSFIQWGAAHYPAKKTALILWDHGGGWQGMLHDQTDNPKGMSVSTLSVALANSVQSLNKKLDLVAFDMCLMAQLEVDSAIADYAQVVVSSEELAPGEGIDYQKTLNSLSKKPQMNNKELAKVLVDTYWEFYQQQGRAEGVTLSAVDLTKISEVERSFNDLIRLVHSNLETNWKALARASGLVETFARDRADFGSVDLLDLTDLITSQTQVSPEITQASKRVRRAIESALIHSIRGKAHPYSSGIATYFPLNENFFDQSYLQQTLSQKTSWGETLSNYYQTRQRVGIPEPQVVIKNKKITVRPGDTATIDYTISGKDLFDVRYYTVWNTDKPVILEEYYPRYETELGKALQPFEDGVNQKQILWPATTLALSNGEKTVYTTIQPYGRSLGTFSLLYTEGLYQSVEGVQTPMTLVFDPTDNTIVYSWAYFDLGNGTITPVEIPLQPGDTFTPNLKSLNLNTGQIEGILDHESALTYGSNGFFLTEEKLLKGSFSVEIAAENLAGNFGYGSLEVNVAP